MTTSSHCRLLQPICSFLLFLGMVFTSHAQISWNFDTAAPASGIPANLTVGDITQGNNNGTTTMLTSASVSNSYSGFSAGNNAGLAARTGPLDPALSGYFETTLTPAAGSQVTLIGLSFGTRSTNSGPLAYTLRTSVDGFTADAAMGTLTNNSVWVRVANNGLSLTSAEPLTLRLFAHSNTGTATASTANFRIDDLILNVSMAPANTQVPIISGFTPDSGPPGTVVTITGMRFGASPTVRFNGTTAAGATVNPAGTSISVNAPAGASTGPITVTAPGGTASSAADFTLPPPPELVVAISVTNFPENGTTEASVQRPATVDLTSPLTVTLSSNSSRATVPATVVIPAGEILAVFTVTGVPDGSFGPSVPVTITASAPGFLSGAQIVAVTNVDPPPPPPAPTVVINKWLNLAPDTVELLVVGSGVAGTTLDMQGMILKDFSASMGSDNGGRRTFAAVPPFDAVPVGTLIVLAASTTSSDVDPADFVMRIGLSDPAYFSGTGTFDLSATELVLIKAAGSDPAGTAGAIHALAAGVLGTPPADPNTLFANYGSIVSFKLIADGTNSAIVGNPNAVLADFNGGPATTSTTLAAADFGKPNNPANNSYIRSLRGITTLSGVGSASLVNNTPGSPFLGRNIFGRSLTGQSIDLTVFSNVNPGTLTRLSVEVPAILGTPLLANISVSGAGAGSPVVSVAGQTISITGTSVTTTNPAVISIAGLTTPAPTGTAADGLYPLIIRTAGPTGSLEPIVAAPNVTVIIPIESLRDVDPVTGVPNDQNKIVAVDGVITEENFNTSQLSGFIQDGNFGLNIFSFNLSVFPPLIRNNRYVIRGTLIQFAGLTEISPAGAADVINLGPGTPPVPLVVTAAQIAAPTDPLFLENLEGRLITVTDLNYVSGNWSDPAGDAVNNVVLTDGAGNNITVRIAQETTANTPPAYPLNVTGILSQAALAGNLFSGYVLMPRDPGDLSTAAVPGYGTWAAAFPGIGGPNDDADGDGQQNLVEYALGTLPNDRSSIQPLVVSMIQGKPGISLTKGTQAGVDAQIQYLIEGSDNLAEWFSVFTIGNELEEVVNTSSSLSVVYLGTSARHYFRLRIATVPAAPG